MLELEEVALGLNTYDS